MSPLQTQIDTRAGGDPPDGPATAKGRATRAQLIAAARQVFERKGFLDARVADITTEAGLSYGSFYTYFPAKEDVFREVVRGLVEEMFTSGSQEGDGTHLTDPVDSVRAANDAFFAAYRRNAALIAIIEQVATFNEEFRTIRRGMRQLFVARAERGIRRLQRQGLADAGLDAHVAANALGSMVDNFAYVWLVLGEPFDEEAVSVTLARLWAQAIGLPTGSSTASSTSSTSSTSRANSNGGRTG